MKNVLVHSLAIFFVISAFLSGAEGIAGTYTTTFPLTENPISENGNWVGGQTAGNNLWGNCQTNGTMAYGVSEPTQFGDPTAILKGTWGANQQAQATVKINTVPSSGSNEVEIRLRSTISSNSITGYEVYCSVRPTDQYCHIARWNGPNGKYCNIEASTPIINLVDGDILKGAVTGTNPVTITGTVTRSGSVIATWSATDTGQNCSPGGAAGPWTSGNPGIGFYNNNGTNWNYFGFSSFTASDGSSSSALPAPLNLRVVE